MFPKTEREMCGSTGEDGPRVHIWELVNEQLYTTVTSSEAVSSKELALSLRDGDGGSLLLRD